MTCRTRCGMSPVRAHAHRMPVDTCTLVLLWCCVRRCVRIGTTLQVADFGTARLVTSARSRLRTVEAETGFGAGEAMPIALTATMTRGVGTPLWMAPELFEGGSSYGPEVDVCKDIDTSAVHLEPASPTPPFGDLLALVPCHPQTCSAHHRPYTSGAHCLAHSLAPPPLAVALAPPQTATVSSCGSS